MRLSVREIATYRRDGLVVLGYRLPSTRLEQLREAVETVLTTNPDVRGERLINPHLN